MVRSWISKKGNTSHYHESISKDSVRAIPKEPKKNSKKIKKSIESSWTCPKCP